MLLARSRRHPIGLSIEDWRRLTVGCRRAAQGGGATRRFICDTLLSLAAAIWKQERPPAAAAHPLHSQKTARTAPACACRHTLHQPSRTCSAHIAPARDPGHLSQPAAPAPFVHRSYGEAGESVDDNWRQRRLRSREPGAARQRRRRLAKQRTGTDRAEELLCCTQHGQGCMASYVVLSFSLFLSLVCA